MRTLLSVALIVTLISCGQIGAVFRSTDHFIELESDQRIYYESDAFDLARHVSQILEEAIELVETHQYGPFVEPIPIYVCGTKERFAQLTGLNKTIKAAVFNGKIFLSASLKDQPDRIFTLTTHELSHLHFIQRIGTATYVSTIPSWFVEGVAVVVSNGGGAERVSENDAARSILDGMSFYPDSTGRMFFPKTASSYHLKPHMFYRQSAMFVQFIKDDDPERFKELLLAIQNKGTFDHAFRSSYERDMDFYWAAFKNKLSNQMSSGEKSGF